MNKKQKKSSDLVRLPGLHLWYLILCTLLTACGSSEPPVEKLSTFDTRKPYESKLTTAPICPITDENGQYNMTDLSEDEIVHIMQYGCRNETPDGYKSPYKHREYTYESAPTQAPPPEQLDNQNLPDFDMFMTP